MKYLKALSFALIAVSFCACDNGESEDLEMQGLYQESCHLKETSLDSVYCFAEKLNDVTTTQPALKEHRLYPKVVKNIDEAKEFFSFSFNLTFETEWAGEIFVEY